MYFSRSLDELQPRVAKKARQLIEACHVEDIELVVLCTYRDLEAEQALYDQGHSKPGKVVTTGWPTQSLHPYRLAFDVVPLRFGSPVWQAHHRMDQQLWQKVGALGAEFGLEWGGAWTHRRKEYPHFQLTEGLTIEKLRAGQMIR